jgi:valyl-tRNA synthetase
VEAVGELAAWVLGRIRTAKSERKVSMRAPVARVVVRDSEDRLTLIRQVADDIREAGSVAVMEMESVAPAAAGGDSGTVEVEFPETEG